MKAQSTTILDKNWQNTFTLMKEKDPLAGHILTWIYATQTNLPIEPKDLMQFTRENADWPRLGDFREKIEENISESGLSSTEIANWFRLNPPESFEGVKAAIKAFQMLGDPAAARQTLVLFWRSGGKLDSNETAALASEYRGMLSSADHATRLDALIWSNRLTEAEYMLAFVPRDVRALGQARIGLDHMSSNADGLVNAVPDALQSDEGLLFSRARWRRRKNMDDGALDIIRSIKNTQRPDVWWEEMNILVRRAIEEKDFRRAYNIASLHSATDGLSYAQAEWLMGWMELRFLNKPDEALRRFGDLYFRVNSAISKSRAAYWAARAAGAQKMTATEKLWHEESAAFLSTYYGQLSRHALHGENHAPKAADPVIPAATVQAFNARSLVRAVRMLKKAGLDQCIDSFLAKIVMLAETRADHILAARLAHEMGSGYYAVQANKDIQQKGGAWLLKDGYPTLKKTPSAPDKALIHAIIYRESMFNPAAISPAGARGLMQLMPATAKSYTKNKKKFKVENLNSDSTYNVETGSAYLAAVLKKYGNNAPVSIAIYNAGPGNVSKWKKMFGDPADKDIDMIDWVELIPNHETRNYVQRVMESWYMYRLKFGGRPMTVLDYD